MRTGADEERREARYLACGRADRKTAGPRRSACDVPRESDGKMHRDGQSAAVRQQPDHPVAECGRVHGAPELMLAEALLRTNSVQIIMRKKDEPR